MFIFPQKIFFVKTNMFRRCRGPIKVKGKGDMITYLLIDPLNAAQYNICREYQGKKIVYIHIIANISIK